MIRIMTDKRLQAITETAFIKGVGKGREEILNKSDRYIERENEARDKGNFLISTAAFDKSLEDAKACGRYEEKNRIKERIREAQKALNTDMVMFENNAFNANNDTMMVSDAELEKKELLRLFSGILENLI